MHASAQLTSSILCTIEFPAQRIVLTTVQMGLPTSVNITEMPRGLVSQHTMFGEVDD